MCYNITYLENRARAYHERYKDLLPPDWSRQHIQFEEEYPAYYFVSGFSHPKLPIVKPDGIFLYEWGLIPSWVKDTESANEIKTKTLNCVGETAFEKSSFKKSISSKRCLLGINGFIEWRDFNKKKYPYFIKVKSDIIFSLGCIYEDWVDRSTGEIKKTFSVVTTPANALMEKIHNLKKRMPLIIPRSREAMWIDSALDKENVIALIKPFSESEMEAYPISTDVNSARNNRNIPEILNKVEYPELD